MKKFLVMALVVVMALSVIAFAACEQPQTYTGEYGYENYGTKYGFKVNVTVSGDKITKVEILESEYAETTSAEHWNQEGVDNWNNNKATFLKNFEGMTVEKVNAIVATVKDENGAEATKVDGITHVTGATQSSARLVLAVQNALSKIGM